MKKISQILGLNQTKINNLNLHDIYFKTSFIRNGILNIILEPENITTNQDSCNNRIQFKTYVENSLLLSINIENSQLTIALDKEQIIKFLNKQYIGISFHDQGNILNNIASNLILLEYITENIEHLTENTRRKLISDMIKFSLIKVDSQDDNLYTGKYGPIFLSKSIAEISDHKEYMLSYDKKTQDHKLNHTDIIFFRQFLTNQLENTNPSQGIDNALSTQSTLQLSPKVKFQGFSNTSTNYPTKQSNFFIKRSNSEKNLTSQNSFTNFTSMLKNSRISDSTNQLPS